jgi:hypothetical protein
VSGFTENLSFSPLLQDTVDALDAYGNSQNFINHILASLSVLRDLTFNLTRGPLFSGSDLRTALDTISDGACLAPHMSADMLTIGRDIMANYLMNCKATRGSSKWYFERVKTNLKATRNIIDTSGIQLVSMLKLMLQYKTYDTDEETANAAASVIVMAFGGAMKWVDLIGTDNIHHKENVAVILSLTLGLLGSVLHLSPVPGPGVAADAFLGPLTQIIQNKVNRKYEGNDGLKKAFQALMYEHFLGPAEEGWRAPGFRDLSKSEFEDARADPGQTEVMAARKRVGNMYVNAVGRIANAVFDAP